MNKINIEKPWLFRYNQKWQLSDLELQVLKLLISLILLIGISFSLNLSSMSKIVFHLNQSTSPYIQKIITLLSLGAFDEGRASYLEPMAFGLTAGVIISLWLVAYLYIFKATMFLFSLNLFIKNPDYVAPPLYKKDDILIPLPSGYESQSYILREKMHFYLKIDEVHLTSDNLYTYTISYYTNESAMFLTETVDETELAKIIYGLKTI